MIGNNPHIFDKKLWSDKGHGEVIRVITCRNDDDESERVVKDLLTHKLMNGKSWKDYAILYRGNFQARASGNPITSNANSVQVIRWSVVLCDALKSKTS